MAGACSAGSHADICSRHAPDLANKLAEAYLKPPTPGIAATPNDIKPPNSQHPINKQKAFPKQEATTIAKTNLLLSNNPQPKNLVFNTSARPIPRIVKASALFIQRN